MSGESDIFKKEILILGCGNILLGDDGFGPAVARHILENCRIPENIYVADVGTSVRGILFDLLLSPEKPGEIVIVDAVDCGRPPGELFELDVEDLPRNKIDDFSMHQLPTSNLLAELREFSGIRIKILACQTQVVPAEVSPGLSETLQAQVHEAAQMLARKYLR